MGMSTHVIGFKNSEEHDKHVRILEFCKKEGVSVPRETAAYFGDDNEGISADSWSQEEIEAHLETSLGSACTNFRREMEDGFEIDVAKLPKDVKIIRFINSY